MNPTEGSSTGSLSGSFRDPSGHMFLSDGVLFRQVNEVYREHYETLIESGLYASLVERGYLIPHEEISGDVVHMSGAYKILRPERIPFISYPYEWCCSQLRDAALLTLEIQELALGHGMILKDASAYNIQFRGTKPVFIDTLSFEKYEEGKPWIAYRQFCQHFLAPLALMSKTDARLGGLSRTHLDGVPLDLASKLLPFSTQLSPGLFAHLHLHSKSQQYFANKPVRHTSLHMRKSTLQGLVVSLRNTVTGLKSPVTKTEWGAYYTDNSYSEIALKSKLDVITGMLKIIQPQTVWDLGANSGLYSRAASTIGIPTVSFDLDHAAVESNYSSARKKGESNILPLVLDVTNPSPALGWANDERFSLTERGPADVVMALALVHHLAISNQLPFGKIAEYFAALTQSMIIEFVPKSDVQVQRLLASRKDVFSEYTEEAFVAAFSRRFQILEIFEVTDSPRKIYRMEKIVS